MLPAMLDLHKTDKHKYLQYHRWCSCETTVKTTINFPIAEPDLFPVITNTTLITAEQLANDFTTLKKLLTKLNLNPAYIAGPDTTQGGGFYLKG